MPLRRHLWFWLGLAWAWSCAPEPRVAALDAGPAPTTVPGARKVPVLDPAPEAAPPSPEPQSPEPAAPPESPPEDPDDAGDSPGPLALDAGEVAGALAPPFATGAAPVLVADGRAPELYALARNGRSLGRRRLPGVARGLRHDRRARDGYWVLLEGEAGPSLVKLDWSGGERSRFLLRRTELQQARRLRGLDFVFGHQPDTDLLLVLYDNVRGIPVVEGISAANGETRFATRFDGGEFAGLRAETYRHGTSQSLIMLEWWVVRDGRSLELWRYNRGFLSREDQRPLPEALLAFDLPPWREIWGVRDGELLRIPPQGPPIPISLPGIWPSAVSIDE